MSQNEADNYDLGTDSPPVIDLWQNSMQEFRDRIIMILGFVTIPFLSPFLVEHIINGRLTMSVVAVLVMFILMVNSCTLYRSKKQLVPIWLFFILLHIVLFYSAHSIGGEALFWSFPLLFIMIFVASKSTVKFLTSFSLVFLIACAFELLNFEYASRFAITIILTCIFSSVLVNYLTKMQDELSGLAVRDPLTNALNRRQMDAFLNDAIEETKRGFGPASLVLLDIDHFKVLNDSQGHGVGDKVLVDLVETLHQRQRRLDHVFRIGGEEFLILLRNTELKHAITTAESLRLSVEEDELFEGQAITVSLGVAEYQTGESSEEWLARADVNLYEAKNLGRNRVHPVFA